MSNPQDIQAKISGVWERLEARFKETGQPWRGEWLPEIEQLRLEIGAEQLIVELIRYAHDDSRAMDEGMFGIVMARLLVAFSQDDLLIAKLAPLLGKPRGVGESARDMLGVIEGRSPDFGRYVEYLKAQGDQVPQAFYTHIYSRDAGQAMLTVTRAQDVNANRMRELQWKAHLVETARWRIQHRYVEPDAPVVDEGRKALRELAADEAWWVRLYAAHIAVEATAGRILSDEALREALQNDPNKLVAATSRRE